jgi:hypothetical protein
VSLIAKFARRELSETPDESAVLAAADAQDEALRGCRQEVLLQELDAGANFFRRVDGGLGTEFLEYLRT